MGTKKGEVTLKDVARLAKVSVGTVSNVLNRPTYVSEELRSQVQEVIKKLNFEPSKDYRRYRRGRAINIGLCLADMSNPFFMNIALSAEITARENNAGVVITHSGEDFEQQERNLELLKQHRVQGIILTSVTDSEVNFRTSLPRDFPLVLIDRVPKNFQGLSVTVDDATGGRLAGQHFRHLKFKRVAYVGSPRFSAKMKSRLDGFKTGFGQREKIGDFSLIEVDDWNFSSGLEAGRRILKMPKSARPRAVFCGNDDLALGILQEMTSSNVRVPEDLAIMGYDDLPAAREAATPITSLRQPLNEVGELSVKMLVSVIEQKKLQQKRKIVLKPELVARVSTLGR